MKKAIGIASGLSTSLLYATIAFAQSKNIDPCSAPGGKGAALTQICAVKDSNIIGGLLNLAFVIGLLIALFFLVWGGLKWITSGGDKAGVEGARGTIVAAIIGLLVIVLSYFILNIAVQLFLGVSLSQILNVEGGVFK